MHAPLNSRSELAWFDTIWILHYFVGEMDKLEKQLLETTRKIRHWKHIQFVKNGAVTNITMNTDIDRDLNYREKTNKTRFGLIFYHERSVRWT